MKKLVSFICLAAALLVPAMMWAQRVVVLHTNDTHSQIDPDSKTGLGGVARRALLIDSVRAAEPNVVLVDAGDAVQGSLFFTLFGGELEQKLLNEMGYDIQILGNHEFDNGLEALAKNYRNANAELLSVNYDFTGTPLQGMFKPYTLRRFGDKTIGFMGINLNPAGMIDEDNYAGMRWLETIEAANAAAWWLKNIEKADKVIALTHIGYDDIAGTDDRELAAASRNIDVIIGGHTHTLLNPASDSTRVNNADGRPVRIFQTKNKGEYLGCVTIDFDADTLGARLIPVDKRLDTRTTSPLEEIIQPYRHGVDSIRGVRVAKTAEEMPQKSPWLLNWLTDYVRDRAAELSGAPVDIAIMNKGGIRNSLPKGVITKGHIMEMLPFDNRIVVLDIPGKDLLENLRIMAGQQGNGLSRGMDVTYNPATNEIVSATLNGTPIDPDRTYRLATISYLANGGDYMTPLKGKPWIVKSKQPIGTDLLETLTSGSRKGKVIKGDHNPRMKAAK